MTTTVVNRVTALPPRTVSVVRLFAAGHDSASVAAQLHVSQSTVKRDARRAVRILRVRRNVQAALVHTALREGLITLPSRSSGRLEEDLVATLELIADGYTDAEIAAQLHLSLDAVKSRVKRILRALQAEDRAHAVAIGWQLGLLGARRECLARDTFNALAQLAEHAVTGSGATPATAAGPALTIAEQYPCHGVRFTNGRTLHSVKRPKEHRWWDLLEAACGKTGYQARGYPGRPATRCAGCAKAVDGTPKPSEESEG